MWGRLCNAKREVTALFTWVVLAPLLGDATLFLHFTENPIQVIRFDFHLLGDLRCGDTGVLLDQSDRLIGAGATATAATAFFARCRGRRGCRCGIFTWATGAASGARGATGATS